MEQLSEGKKEQDKNTSEKSEDSSESEKDKDEVIIKLKA